MTELVIQTVLNLLYCFELAVLDQSWIVSGKSDLLLCSIVYLIYKFSVQRTTCVQSRFAGIFNGALQCEVLSWIVWMDVSVKYTSFIYSDVKRDCKCSYAYECEIVLNKVIDNSNDINKYIIFQTKLSHHVSYIWIWYHEQVADI